MKLEIIAFGIAKEILGGNTLSYQLDGAPTVEHLLQSLESDFPGFKGLASLAVAVNSEYAQPDQTLSESDEVVLIPPVSGG